MDGNIVEFPGPVPPLEGYSEQYIDKLHSRAFRDLATSLRDCVRMGGIVAQLMFDVDTNRAIQNERGLRV